MIEIIPAIDVIGGRCVRLTRGDYNTSRVYSDDPLDMAHRFEDCGIKRLHLVDLDGARSHHIVNYHTLERIASGTGLSIDFGGGIKSDEDIHIAYESGAAMVTGGSIAVKQPDKFIAWLETYGASRLILGADARNGRIATDGWYQCSDIDVVDFINRYAALGVTQVISTDINADGTLKGPSTELYRRILQATPSLKLIASGGVGSLSDIENLDREGVPGVIVGKAIYEGHITLSDLERLSSTQTINN